MQIKKNLKKEIEEKLMQIKKSLKEEIEEKAYAD